MLYTSPYPEISNHVQSHFYSTVLHPTQKCLLTGSPTPWLGSLTRFLWKVSLKPKRHPSWWQIFVLGLISDNVISFLPGAILPGGVGCVHSGHIKARREDWNPRADKLQSGDRFSVNRSDPSRRYMFLYFSCSTSLPERMAMLVLFIFSFGLAILQACRAIDSGSGKRTQIEYYSFKWSRKIVIEVH